MFLLYLVKLLFLQDRCFADLENRKFYKVLRSNRPISIYKIQPKTIDLSAMLWGADPINSIVISQGLKLVCCFRLNFILPGFDHKQA